MNCKLGNTTLVAEKHGQRGGGDVASSPYTEKQLGLLRAWKFIRSGSVCLDVINQTWSPMFDMINIFEVFLPQLLRYPNPTDPLNGEAAALLMREPKSYDVKVKGRRSRSRSPEDPGWDEIERGFTKLSVWK